jgi:cell division protein ZapA (FtsZ GTPase activity inhibitor)
VAKEIVIKILNRDYFVKDDVDPLLLAAFARYVEDKMKEAGEKNNIVDTSKIAVHTALSICKELFEERSKLENHDRKINQLAEELSKAVDS